MIYTFYSYKGGVGRSMALANVAALLAGAGKKVLIIDWDLEAPGIERYFTAVASQIRSFRRTTPGVLDIILGFEAGRTLDWRTCLIEVRPFAYGNPLHIITAGQDSPQYSELVQGLEWDRLFSWGLGRRIEALRMEWTEQYDYVLVDSRTGISDIGGICTILLPDRLVLFFTTNETSLNGVIEVMHGARTAQARLPLDRARLVAIPIPARDESQNEYDQAKKWRERFARLLQPIYRDWLPENVTAEDALKSVYIPYWAYWSFGERLPVVEDSGEIENPRSLAAAYSRLSRLIAGDLDWNTITAAPESLYEARSKERLERRRARLFRSAAYAGLLVSSLLAASSILLFRWQEEKSAKSKASAIMAAASAASDPLNRVLLLAELKGLPEPQNGREQARKLLKDPVPLTVLRGHRGALSDARFVALEGLSGGKVPHAVTAGEDGTVRFWDLNSGREVQRLEIGSLVSALSSSEDSRFLALGDWAGTVRIFGLWSRETKKLWPPRELRPFSIHKAVQALDLSASNYIAVRAEHATVIWKINDDETVKQSVALSQGLVAFGLPVRSLRTVPSTPSAAVGYRDGRVALVNLVTGRGDPFRERHQEAVVSISFGPNGQRFITGSRDSTARVWRVEGTGRPIVLRGHQGPVAAVGLSPNGFQAVTCSEDGRVRLWRVSDIEEAIHEDAESSPSGGPPRQLIVSFGGPRGRPVATEFSSDGEWILVASSGGPAMLWKVAGGEQGLLLSGHEGPLVSARFNGDGSKIITASVDGTARLWEVNGPQIDLEKLGWSELVQEARNLTRECLAPEQRVRVLGESKGQAQMKYEACISHNQLSGKRQAEN